MTVMAVLNRAVSFIPRGKEAVLLYNTKEQSNSRRLTAVAAGLRSGPSSAQFHRVEKKGSWKFVYISMLLVVGHGLSISGCWHRPRRSVRDLTTKFVRLTI
jgi:hypothetical protein